MPVKKDMEMGGLTKKVRGSFHPGNKEKKKEVRDNSAKCYEIHFEYYGDNPQCSQK